MRLMPEETHDAWAIVTGVCTACKSRAGVLVPSAFIVELMECFGCGDIAVIPKAVTRDDV